MDFEFLDRFRRQASEAEQSLIEGALRGSVSRRDLFRHGGLLGLSLPLIGRLGAAAGLGAAALPSRARAAPGGVIRVGMGTPSTAIDPVIVPDANGLAMLQQTGEFLVVDGPDLVLRPALATSWSPNKDGSVWTFKIRTGVKFHNGAAMTAKDVAASFNRLADPDNKSNALSAFTGVLSKGGAKATDDQTVEFHLDAPNGNFPYIISSDNYNAIIIPADMVSSEWEKTFIGTGPFKLEKYTPKVGASFVRNPDYWGEKAVPDRTEFIFYPDIQPQILALQGGDIDLIKQAPVLSALPLLNDPKFSVISVPSVAHQQLHIRCDQGAFQDKRVRQALALSLDREKIVQGLLRGRAKVGNDSPFASIYPSTDKSVPQRKQDLAKAKQLLEEAGAKNVKVTLTTENFLEIPQFAQIVQGAAKQIGIDIALKIEDVGAYYGDAVYGKSDWLDSAMGITDYGHRGVPNVYLAAPMLSTGTWNGAHFKNAQYDGLVKDYVAALDLETQRASAGKIQRLLLDETPIIFAYFYDYLAITAKGVEGVEVTAMNQVFLEKAKKG